MLHRRRDGVLMGYELDSTGHYVLDSSGDPISDGVAPTTPLSLIIRALKKSGVLGVGQSASAEDVQDAFADLNDMVGQWARKRWLIFNLRDEFITSTGAVNYTIGPGGDFNIPRPDRLEFGYFRQLGSSNKPVDYPLEILQAREDYARITIKDLQGFPLSAFYDAAFEAPYGRGRIYSWPVIPPTQYELHILVKQPLGSFFSLTQSINLPPEYNEAILYNLAARLRPSYQLPPDAQITALALTSLNVIKIANAQIPLLRLPTAVIQNGIPYNIFSNN
jgi:hypothetical protein